MEGRRVSIGGGFGGVGARSGSDEEAVWAELGADPPDDEESVWESLGAEPGKPDASGMRTDRPKRRLTAVSPEEARRLNAEGAMPFGEETAPVHVLEPIDIEGDPEADPSRPAPVPEDFEYGGDRVMAPTGRMLVEMPDERRARLAAGGQRFTRTGETASDVTVPIGTIAGMGANVPGINAAIQRYLNVRPEVTYNADAAATAVADTLTAGFTDEIAGAGAAARGEDYETGRDAVRARREQQMERPEGQAGALVGTGLALPIVAAAPGPSSIGAVRALGPAARVGAAAAEGALLGAAADVGMSESEGLESIGDIGPGAGTGLVAGGALSGVAEAAPALARSLQGADDYALRANERRLRAMFGAERPPRRTFREMVGPRRGRAERVEQRLADYRGAGISTADDAARVQDEAADAMDQSAGAVDAALAARGYRDAAPIETVGSAIGRRIRDRAREMQVTRGVSGDVVAAMEREAARWETAGPMSFRRAWRFRQEMSRPEYWTIGPRGEMSQAYAHRRDLYSIVRDEMLRAADEVAPEAASRFRAASHRYHIASPLAEAADEATMRAAQNRQVGLTDTIAAASGQGLLGTIGGFLGNRAVRAVEHHVVARGYDTVARLARSNPQSLGRHAQAFGNAARRGPAALAALYFSTVQTDPDFRAQMRALDDPNATAEGDYAADDPLAPGSANETIEEIP
jgi:hypothetical protein